MRYSCNRYHPQRDGYPEPEMNIKRKRRDMLRSLFLKSDEFTKADITRSENEAALTAATQSEWVDPVRQAP
jgi:hypothetical protein